MTQPHKETLVTIRSGRGATLKDLSFGALLMAVGAGILFYYVRYRRALAKRPLLDR